MMIELGVPTRRWNEYETGVLDAQGMPVRRDREATPTDPGKDNTKDGEAVHVEEASESSRTGHGSDE
jgi:hypothetical protein